MAALATTNFRVQGCVFPHLRVAIWATLSSSSKNQDGFSKILTKSDVEKLRAPNMSGKIMSTETMLADSWKVAQDPALDKDNATKTMPPRLMVGSVCEASSFLCPSRSSPEKTMNTRTLLKFSKLLVKKCKQKHPWMTTWTKRN